MPAHRRPVNTVFQSYALFPFLNVWDNVAFGLRYRKASKQETTRRVGEILELIQMSDYARRRPAQLSGGQQQRVALARALVLNPSVLLLDEPLGALDAKLRKHLQLELKALQQSVGVTFVYVTHDQEEALTMSDRLAVMRDGLVEQVGAPEAVYAAPESAYVAGFLGSANLLDVEVLGPDADAVACRLGSLPLRAVGTARTGPGEGHRPARTHLARDGRHARHDPRGPQRVPRPRRPRRLPRPDDPRRAAPGRRPDAAGRGAQRGRAAVLTVRRRAARYARPSPTEAARLLQRRDRALGRPAEALPDQRASAVAPAELTGGAASTTRRARSPRTSSRSRRPARGRRPGPRERPGWTVRRAARRT